MGLTMLFHIRVPMCFLGRSFSTATRPINRLPSQILGTYESHIKIHWEEAWPYSIKMLSLFKKTQNIADRNPQKKKKMFELSPDILRRHIIG